MPNRRSIPTTIFPFREQFFCKIFKAAGFSTCGFFAALSAEVSRISRGGMADRKSMFSPLTFAVSALKFI
jgi:hypothetical protein